MKYRKINWEDIQQIVQKNIIDNNIIVDSFLEDHIYNSNHYEILDRNRVIGYFQIYKKEKLVGFYLEPAYCGKSQEIFYDIKKFEQVTSAMVSTSDEFFLSHCLDSYVSLSKQAYFSIHSEKEFEENHFNELELYPVLTQKDIDDLSFTGDFYSKEDNQKILDGLDYYKVFIVKSKGLSIGSGIIEYGRVDNRIASIGMFVAEAYRCLGYGKSILHALRNKVEEEGYICRSGCWYYNHNSKKSMEAAGFYSKTRLINFTF